MRTFTILLAALTLAACGGSDAKTADAKLAFDAPTGGNPDAPTGGNPDAPAGGPGLASTCTQQMACPANAPDCYGGPTSQTTGWCSLNCAAGIMSKPNAQGQFPGPADQAAADAVCAAQFSGSVGTAKCAFIANLNPDPGNADPDPNTTYTYDAICALQCGAGNTCPAGLTCTQGFCYP